MMKLLKYAKKYAIYIMLAPICIMLEVVFQVYIPRVMSLMVDEGIPSGDISYVARLGLIMIGMAILSMITGALSSYFSSKGGIGFGTELRKAVFYKIQDFSFENIDKFQQSSLITRLTTDIEYVQQGMMQMTRMFVRAPFMMIMAIVMASQINVDLMGVFAYATPVLVVVIGVVGYFAMPLFKRMMERYDELNLTVQEDLTNIRIVKAAVREDYEKERFSFTNKDLMNASIKVELIIAFLSPVMMIVTYACIIAIIWLGGQDIIAGTMGTGELISFISYVSQILSGLIMIAMIFMNIVQMRGSVARINEVLDSEVYLVDGPEDYLVEEGSVEFKNVDFSYNAKASEKVLKDINFKVNAGEFIGIIGATGSGKTSLVNLIPRLYDVTSGEVLVSGHNVKDYKLKNLRDDVAMVLQQNVLFSGTIKDNIRWGNEDATDEQIIEACKQAQADDFISAFPDGYDTELGQGGVNLSGGQKQRLCIARAIIRKPKIVILDDSTSAVDTATDAAIRKALNEQLSGTTTFVIAQRISSVIDADRVIVLDNGKIVDFDTPENLLKTNEIFKDIYNTQMKGVEENA